MINRAAKIVGTIASAGAGLAVLWGALVYLDIAPALSRDITQVIERVAEVEGKVIERSMRSNNTQIDDAEQKAYEYTSKGKAPPAPLKSRLRRLFEDREDLKDWRRKYRERFSKDR